MCDPLISPLTCLDKNMKKSKLLGYYINSWIIYRVLNSN